MISSALHSTKDHSDWNPDRATFLLAASLAEGATQTTVLAFEVPGASCSSLCGADGEGKEHGEAPLWQPETEVHPEVELSPSETLTLLLSRPSPDGMGPTSLWRATCFTQNTVV